jgi:hypothetical protein
MEELKNHIRSFFPFAQKRMGFDRPPKLFLKQDGTNAKDVLGKTAQYNPQDMSITLFTMGRHPKDILRSLSHELVHHSQNCRGDFEGGMASEDGYAQNDPHLREMEREAYEQGNLCFRDWEDSIKYGGGEQTMALNERKLREAIRGALKKIMTEDFVSDSAQEEAAEGEQKGTKTYPGGESDDEETKEEGMKYTRDDDDDGMEEAVKWGGNKGDKSKTDKGEKDYTTKKGEKKKTTSPGRGEKKGDEAYVNEGEEEEELEEGGRANRRENEDQGEERRMKSSSAMRENRNSMPVQEWYRHSLFDRLTERFTRD